MKHVELRCVVCGATSVGHASQGGRIDLPEPWQNTADVGLLPVCGPDCATANAVVPSTNA